MALCRLLSEILFLLYVDCQVVWIQLSVTQDTVFCADMLCASGNLGQGEEMNKIVLFGS